MTLCTEIESLITNAIDESIREVFAMMIGEDLQQTESARVLPRVGTVRDSGPELTVVMGLTGDLQGSLSLTLDESAALRWTDRLVDIAAEAIDQTVVDAVGELGNMVVGGAKRRLVDFQLTISLPSVIRVGIDQLSFASGTIPLGIRYHFGECLVMVVIAISDQCSTTRNFASHTIGDDLQPCK